MFDISNYISPPMVTILSFPSSYYLIHNEVNQKKINSVSAI